MRSIALSRHATLAAIGVEVFATVDGQGVPAYAASTDVNMRVLRQQKVAIDADGSELRTDLTCWVPASETTQPNYRDRVTYASEQFIVMAVKEVKDLSDAIVHTRLRCRRE